MHSGSSPSDLAVELVSDSLSGLCIDVVVTGSVAAPESVRFIRSLRRLGARVRPWLSQGASQFITTDALAWAADQPVANGSQARALHISDCHALVIAPASANFLGKTANGIADTPETVLAMSFLGQKKPIIAMPCMHDSMFDSPTFQANYLRLQQFGVHFAMPRSEEGKRKFPIPPVGADFVSHCIRASQGRSAGMEPNAVLLTMGGTRSPIDAVRCVANISTGRVGSHVAEELFRHGHATHVVCAGAETLPTVYSTLTRVQTNAEMTAACTAKLQHSEGKLSGVFAAAMNDFVSATPLDGKISSELEELKISLQRAPKMIASLAVPRGRKIAFKLIAGEPSPAEIDTLAKTYMQRNDLQALIVNHLRYIGERQYQALIYRHDAAPAQPIGSRRELARAIVDLV